MAEKIGKRKLEKQKRRAELAEKQRLREAEQAAAAEAEEEERRLLKKQGGEAYRLLSSSDEASAQARDREKVAHFFAAAKRDPSFASLDVDLRGGAGRFQARDMSESMKPYLIAALLASDPARKILVIVADELAQRHLAQECAQLPAGDMLRIFPARELEFLDADAVNRDLEFARLRCLRALYTGESRLVLTTAAAASQMLETPQAQKRRRLRLERGTIIEPAALRERLVALGFERVSLCSEMGQFSQRGEILDFVPVDDCLWRGEDETSAGAGAASDRGEDSRLSSASAAGAPDGAASLSVPEEMETGIRISFFDDEIERIDRFRLSDQRSLCSLEACELSPQREVLLSEAERTALAATLRRRGQEERKQRLQRAASRDAAEQAAQLYFRDAERAEHGELFPALDRYLSYIWEDAGSLLDYADEEGFLILCDEPLRLRERLDQQQAQWRSEAESLLERIEAPEEILGSTRGRADFFRRLEQCRQVLAFSSLLHAGNGLPGAKEYRLIGRESESRRGLEQRMVREFLERKQEGETPFLLVAEELRRKKLRELILQEAPELGDVTLPVALQHGFEYPAAGLYCLSSDEIFGSKLRRPKRRRKKTDAIPLFTDLKPGEALVHDVHGIGIYRGLTQIEQGGVKRDYIEIEYAGEDKLFIPMDALDQIQKYIGAEDPAKIKLSRLGSTEWEKAKARARDSIRTLATDLLALYAERREMKGYAFSADTPWYQEFCDRFEFEETDDQLQAVQEISEDMQSDRVMDRLLCGDVGFGKTEVAFRALFKAACDSKQAAFLAPTTVLSQQHYENFRRRLGDFPLRLALLNRFVSPAERSKVLRGLRRGEIDIVIGTHRLLSKDVEFRDLGLLIVDEEQRFGVDHKEGLKERYPKVDVLSLSATPIPRTLHMSLSGIRDISVIEEAPENRRPVRTYVMEYDLAFITDAILREVNRKGQVFYLFNNVREMDKEMKRLHDALPGLRILKAHGQMQEHQLEKVIEAFINKEADLLLCSTIIESGIDMPNVNTLIVTQAERFGLSQLYQIKGRVGRSTRQAYAYFTYQKDKILTEEAEKRLAALKEYTRLGSGLKIALKDLEVRGAGNLLGAEQHGQMAAIGYELYCRMLDEEIQALRAERLRAEALAANRAAQAEEGTEELLPVREEPPSSAERMSDGRGKTERARDRRVAANGSEAALRSEAGGDASASPRFSRVRKAAGPAAAQGEAEAAPPVPAEEKAASPFRRNDLRVQARSADTLIELDTDAYISPDYIADDTARVDLYRRIVRMQNYEDYLDLQEEFVDRFGEPPAAIQQLLNVAYVRARASICGIEHIYRRKNLLMMDVSLKQPLRMEALTALMAVKSFAAKLQLDMGSKPALKYFDPPAKNELLLDELRKLFYAAEKLG